MGTVTGDALGAGEGVGGGVATGTGGGAGGLLDCCFCWIDEAYDGGGWGGDGVVACWGCVPVGDGTPEPEETPGVAGWAGAVAVCRMGF